jgi:hypothetical protein
MMSRNRTVADARRPAIPNEDRSPVTQRFRSLRAAAALAALVLAQGCGDDAAVRPVFAPESMGNAADASSPDEKAAILGNILKLIETAPTNPGGANFTMAAESLNDLFRDTKPDAFRLPRALNDYLAQPVQARSLPPDSLARLQRAQFDGLIDGRHLEDCLLLHDAASAVLRRAEAEAGRAGAALTPLETARRLFDWTVRQVQLVPRGALAVPGLVGADGAPIQPPARPYDTLLRGLAVEIDGGWAERSWLFLALCRQAGLDAGYLVVVHPEAPGGVLRRDPVQPAEQTFACGVLIDGEIYLFDARYGLEIAGPGGVGVATLAQASADPAILERFDLPTYAYPVHRDDLATGKIRVLLEATLGSMAPRMGMLQDQLTGERRMVLHRDPIELVERFGAALGPRLESVQLWPMPLEVEHRLFFDALFNQASGYSVQYFNPRWPLLDARLKQLRGNLEGSDGAIEAFVRFRFAEGALERDGVTPIARPVQQLLDIYATHFLAMAQLDAGRPDRATFLFGETLKLLPEPRPDGSPMSLYRWGAHHNLGRLHAEAGKPALAARYFALLDPTAQGLGNYLLARVLVWPDPFVPADDVPVPPPAPTLNVPTLVPRAPSRPASGFPGA